MGITYIVVPFDAFIHMPQDFSKWTRTTLGNYPRAWLLLRVLFATPTRDALERALSHAPPGALPDHTYSHTTTTTPALHCATMASSIGPLHPSPQYPQGMPAPPHHTPPPPHQPYPQPHHGLHVPPSSYGNSYNMAYDPQQSQSSTATMPSYSHSFPNSQQPSFSNGPVSSTGAGYSRSFGQQKYPAPRQYEDSTQIYTVGCTHSDRAISK